MKGLTCDLCEKKTDSPQDCDCGVRTCPECWAEHLDSGCVFANDNGPEEGRGAT